MGYIVLWGHGSWDPDEKPTHTYVPGGCSLYFFARHREEIDTNRMRDIVTSLRLTTGSNRNAQFLSDMKEARSIRNVRGATSRVRNYRLTPSDDRTWMYDEERDVEADVYKLVETTEPKGVTLEALFKAYGSEPGTIFLWVPCRAVAGESFVDFGNGKATSDHAITDDFGKRIGTGRKRGPEYSNKVTL